MSKITEGELLEALLAVQHSSQINAFKAKELLSMYTSLAGVLFSDSNELKYLFGLSNQQIKMISLVREITSHIVERKLSSDLHISEPEYLMYLKLHLAQKQVEGLYIMHFNAAYKYIGMELINVGSVNRVTASYNEVVSSVLNVKAHYIVLAHNHPSGYVRPSFEDLGFTEKLTRILIEFNVVLIDHVIIGGHKVYSIEEKRVIAHLRDIKV